LITDVELRKGNFGGLVRVKAWYDQALNDETVRIGNQANDFNGTRPRPIPIAGYAPCSVNTPAGAPCLPMSAPGQNNWPKAKLSDEGFEDEQKFDNVYLLDAYVYGTFDVGESSVQVRLGNQVINWGESVFIQGVNQVNPIDVPAARRAGAELKEILLPVWAAYANWGFNFGSIEAFYQIQWNNTSVDGCGQYFTVSGTRSRGPGPLQQHHGGRRPERQHCDRDVRPRSATRLAAVVQAYSFHTPRVGRQRQWTIRPGVPFPDREDRHRDRPVE
jgi:hypothetical protein